MRLIKLGLEIGFTGFVAFATFNLLVGIGNSILGGFKRSYKEPTSDKVTKMPGKGQNDSK